MFLAQRKKGCCYFGESTVEQLCSHSLCEVNGMHSEFNEFASHQETQELTNMQVAAEISEEVAVFAQSLENELEFQFF